MNDDSNQDNSSVWSSYSDLFTNVAIIFLVMFVFALFKSGINSIKQIQTEKNHKKELEGKLSKVDIEKKERQVQVITEKINEMKEYENIIDDKVKELNSYAKKIQENKNVLSKVIESQLKQDSLLKIANERLEKEKELKKEQEIALEEATLRIKLLNEELNNLMNEKKQLKKSFEQELKDIQKTTTNKEIVLQNKMKESEQKNEFIISSYEAKIEELNKQISSAKTSEENLKNEIKKFDFSKKNQDEFLAQLSSQIKGLESQIEQNKQAKGALEFEKRNLNNLISSLQKSNNDLSREATQLKGELAQEENISKELQNKLNSLNEKITQNLSDSSKWKKSYDEKLNQVNKLENDLKKAQENFQKLAKTMSALQDSVKNDVTNKLISKFKENNLSAQVNQDTGEVILLSGEGFNFQKGSSKLSKEAKDILKKIIPIYSSVLFEDNKIASQLSSINMEGHSSPSFAGKYVAPEDMNSKAYAFNLRLSALRAASVAEYLMGDEIGNYPHKFKMKKLLQAVGYGYMKPVKEEITPPPVINRSLASVEQDCGPWNCKKSQRVQINFLLKDNLEEIRKIIDSNGGIK